MRVLILHLILLGFYQSDVKAQEADTLDAKGYLPLSVGNSWEYIHVSNRPVSIFREIDESKTYHERYRVIGEAQKTDSVLYEIEYDIRSELGEFVSSNTFVVYYDAESVSIKGNNLPPIFEWLRCLDAPYGTNSNPGVECWSFVYSDEQYVSELAPLEQPISTKSFGSFVWAYWVAHGIGIVSGGGGCEPCSPFSDSDYWAIQYAKIGDQVYGAQIVGTEKPNRFESEEIYLYPNPASDNLHVRVRKAGYIHIYDMTGRQVQSFWVPQAGHNVIDLNGLSNGMYVTKYNAKVSKIIIRR